MRGRQAPHPLHQSLQAYRGNGVRHIRGYAFRVRSKPEEIEGKNKSELKTSLDDSTYDFAYTYYVLQHIDRVRGEDIFAKILRNLNPGGVAVIHFTISCAVREEVMVPDWFYNILRSRAALIRLVRAFLGFDPGDPEMRIVKYDLAKMVLMAEDLGCSLRHTEILRHGGSVVGVALYLVKLR